MRTLHFTMQVSDEEFTNFLARIGQRATVSTDGEDDGAGDNAADPSTLDKAGVPWLESVHASTKGQTKDGFWRGGKGVTKEQRVAAENAWKQQNAAVPTFTPPPSPFNGAPVPGFTPPPAMQMPGFPAPTMQMPGFPAPIEQPVSYEDIAALYQRLMTLGKVNEGNIMKVYQDAGVTDPSALVTDETLRRRLHAELSKYVG